MNHIGTRELATERLTLRRYEIEDAENMYYNWALDPEVTKYLTWEPYTSAETVEEYLSEKIRSYAKPDVYTWAIELNELEQPIGDISAVRVDDSTETVEIGYCMGKKFWNHGYMTEALEAVIRFFINEVRAGRVCAKHDTENAASGKVMKKAGMDFEGILRRAGRNNRGIVDLAIYAKIRSAALDENDETSAEDANLPDSADTSATAAGKAGAAAVKIMGEDGVLRNYISDETMEYVGILAKLELSPEEAEAAKKDMADMLDYIDQLNELDTAGIEPMSHVFPVSNVFRKDIVTNKDGSTATMSNAPVKKDGGFKVPKTIGE